MANLLRKTNSFLRKATGLDALGFDKSMLGKFQDKVLDTAEPIWTDPSKTSYVNPFTGEVVKYKKGGKVKKFSKGEETDDLTPRENLPDKNASEQAREAKKKPKREDDLTPYENLPPKKFAKGGAVRGDGCCMKGKTKGRFR